MDSMDTLLAKYRTATAGMEKLAANTPRIVGNECTKIVKDNFKLQGYDSGYGVKEWEKRKPATDKAYDRGRSTNSKGQKSKYRSGHNATFKGSVYSSENPLLLQTRNLYNAVKYKAISKTVQIGVDILLIPYAEAMNKDRKYMPKPDQQPNVKMLKAIKKKITHERDNIMKEFKK